MVDTWLGLGVASEAMQNTKLQSTISRYACRIIVNREAPHDPRLFAAGFDNSKNIFLGEKACKWNNSRGEIDGLTTNGILLLHPSADNSTGIFKRFLTNFVIFISSFI